MDRILQQLVALNANNIERLKGLEATVAAIQEQLKRLGHEQQRLTTLLRASPEPVPTRQTPRRK